MPVRALSTHCEPNAVASGNFTRCTRPISTLPEYCLPTTSLKELCEMQLIRRKTRSLPKPKTAGAYNDRNKKHAAPASQQGRMYTGGARQFVRRTEQLEKAFLGPDANAKQTIVTKFFHPQGWLVNNWLRLKGRQVAIMHRNKTVRQVDCVDRPCVDQLCRSIV